MIAVHVLLIECLKISEGMQTCPSFSIANGETTVTSNIGMFVAKCYMYCIIPLKPKLIFNVKITEKISVSRKCIL